MMFFNGFDLTSFLYAFFLYTQCPTHKIILNKHFFDPSLCPLMKRGRDRAKGHHDSHVRRFLYEKSDDLLFLCARERTEKILSYSQSVSLFPSCEYIEKTAVW